MRVVGRREVGGGVVEFTLAGEDGGGLRPYVPGSHLPVRVGSKVNAYSLLDDGHRPEAYRIGVRLSGAGGGSAILHRDAHPGSTLEAGDPRSAFPPILSAKKHLLIAAGIGITPLLSHLRAARRWGRPAELVSGAAEGRQAFTDEVLAVSPSQSTHTTGRAALMAAVEDALARQPVGTHAYACGPEGFLRAVQQQTAALGWPAERMHVEHFDTPPLHDGEPFTATAAALPAPLLVPSGQSLLHALDAVGIRLDRQCERGVCGRCELGVRAGTILHRDVALTDADRARGDLMLPCVSRGAGTLDLDLDPDPDPDPEIDLDAGAGAAGPSNLRPTSRTPTSNRARSPLDQEAPR
jgi:ferredoxin-NADP reductase